MDIKGLVSSFLTAAGKPLIWTGTLLQLGGVTSTSAALGSATGDDGSAALTSRLGDNSGYSPMIAAYFQLGSGTAILEGGNGIIRLFDSTLGNFGRLCLGGATASFPSIKRNAATAAFRLADDSGDAAIAAGAATFSGSVLPAADNSIALGNGGSRWASLQVAGQGTFGGNVLSSNSVVCGGTSNFSLNGRSIIDGGGGNSDGVIRWTKNAGGQFTVSQLPLASTAGAGARAFVTDATATTFNSLVAGSGSSGVPVFSDGANWRVG